MRKILENFSTKTCEAEIILYAALKTLSAVFSVKKSQHPAAQQRIIYLERTLSHILGDKPCLLGTVHHKGMALKASQALRSNYGSSVPFASTWQQLFVGDSAPCRLVWPK